MHRISHINLGIYTTSHNRTLHLINQITTHLVPYMPHPPYPVHHTSHRGGTFRGGGGPGGGRVRGEGRAGGLGGAPGDDVPPEDKQEVNGNREDHGPGRDQGEARFSLATRLPHPLAYLTLVSVFLRWFPCLLNFDSFVRIHLLMTRRGGPEPMSLVGGDQ